MESEQAPPIKETKPKRQLTEGQLEQLAKAREKANAVRKRNADMKRKEKELNEMERQAKEKALDKRLSKVGKAPKKKAMPVVEESSDEPRARFQPWPSPVLCFRAGARPSPPLGV